MIFKGLVAFGYVRACLQQKGVATDVINESMGHQNLAITQARLKEQDSSVLDEASELLLA